MFWCWSISEQKFEQFFFCFWLVGSEKNILFCIGLSHLQFCLFWDMCTFHTRSLLISRDQQKCNHQVLLAGRKESLNSIFSCIFYETILLLGEFWCQGWKSCFVFYSIYFIMFVFFTIPHNGI